MVNPVVEGILTSDIEGCSVMHYLEVLQNIYSKKLWDISNEEENLHVLGREQTDLGYFNNIVRETEAKMPTIRKTMKFFFFK